MVIVHRISLRATESQRRELQALGITLPPGIVLPGEGDPLVAFDVEEAHPHWKALEQLLRHWDAGDSVSTRFAKAEIEAARWLNLVPEWHHGYPQPGEDELGFGYRQATYDLTDWCDQCGIGMRQKAPFQMKSEPKWGRRGILQLNWVFDEYFVTPEIWSSVFRPHGIGCQPVMNTKRAELKAVVQLVVEEAVGLVTEGLASERCTKCQRVKYLPVTRGAFPALTTKPTRGMVKTKEYFGSGAAAHQRVLISQALAQAFTAAKVRGASFWPVQPGSGIA